MPNELILLYSSLVTVILTRLSVIMVPEVDIKMFGRVIHHFWFGIVAVILAFPIFYLSKIVGIFTFGAGLGLAGDELVFMLTGGGHDKEYWKLASIIGAIASLFIIFYFRFQFIGLIQ